MEKSQGDVEMTNSLREEIISEILRGNKVKTPEDVVDEIIVKIVKRIDEYIKSKGWDDSNDILEHWARNDIENLKKEMLK